MLQQALLFGPAKPFKKSRFVLSKLAMGLLTFCILNHDLRPALDRLYMKLFLRRLSLEIPFEYAMLVEGPWTYFLTGLLHSKLSLKLAM